MPQNLYCKEAIVKVCQGKESDDIKELLRSDKNKEDRLKKIENLLEALVLRFQSFVANSMSSGGIPSGEPSEYFVRQSPIQLSNKGNKLAEDSKITEFIKNNLSQYSKQLDKRKSKLDVLDGCREIATRQLDKRDEAIIIKDYFYDQGLNIIMATEIFAIKLRDLYYQQKKNK